MLRDITCSCVWYPQMAKWRGLPVSVEVCPHHLTFAAEDVPEGDTRYVVLDRMICMPSRDWQ